MVKLMLVDDESNILEGLYRSINWKDYQIGTIKMSSCYEQAVDIALDFKPDIMLLDICLDEGKTCFDVMDQLRKYNVTPVIVLISGYSEFTFAKNAIRYGVKDYLLKPIAEPELIATLKRVLTEELAVMLTEPDKELCDPVLYKPYSEISSLICKMLHIIEQEYTTKLSLKSIASRFKANSGYLGHLFHKEMGIKFSEYLMAYRFLLAKDRIQNTDEKIVAIAYDVGYPNLPYFYQKFKSFFNVSPLEMRILAGGTVTEEEREAERLAESCVLEEEPEM